MEQTIYQNKQYRIIEIAEEYIDFEELKGDYYNVELNESETLTKEMILSQEKEFEMVVEMQGVFGYQLQVWNAEIGQGWKHVDSCYGFVGDSTYCRHYIIDEFETQIKELLKGGVKCTK